MSLLRHGNFHQGDRVNNFDPYSILYEILYQIKIDLDYQVVDKILGSYAEVYLLEAKEDNALHVAVNITEITLREKHRLDELLMDLAPYNNTCYYMFSFEKLDDKAQLFNPYYKNIKETLFKIKEIPFILEKQQIEESLIQISPSLVNLVLDEESEEGGNATNQGDDKGRGKSGRIKI